MSGLVGTVQEFSKGGNWTQWQDRLELFFEANDITVDKKKVVLLITLMGNKAYAILRNICTPNLPKIKDYLALTTLMTNHLEPAPSIISERNKFKECRQSDRKSVSDFIENLRKLSCSCKFGDNLADHLRDQFVWGLRADSIKKRLLTEKDLKYDKAVELAMSLKPANKDAARMNLWSKADSVNYVTHNNKKKRYDSPSKGVRGKEASSNNEPCACCGRSNHNTSKCRYKNYKCNICNEVGHLKSVCKSQGNNKVNKISKYNNSNNKAKNFEKGKTEKQNFVEECSLNMDDFNDEFNNLFNIKEINAI